MKKTNKKGFVLAETLIVTTIVAGFLIYIFVQLSNLGSSYNISLRSNTVEDLYALDDIIYFLNDNSTFKEYVLTDLSNTGIVDIGQINCTSISNNTIQTSCTKYKSLLEYENITNIYASYNNSSLIDFTSFTDNELKTCILNSKGNSGLDYRLSARFSDGTYATVGW